MAVDKSAKTKEFSFTWEGKDKAGKYIKGDMRGAGEASVSAHLRRQGITVTKIRKSTSGKGKVSRQRHHTFHTPARHHVEVRCTATSSFRHRRQRT